MSNSSSRGLKAFGRTNYKTFNKKVCLLAMFCLYFLYNTNLVSQKSQLVWKLIYARHASNYIHETGTYRAKTQCTNTRKKLFKI